MRLPIRIIRAEKFTQSDSGHPQSDPGALFRSVIYAARAPDRWDDILRLVDEAFTNYVSGLVALRKRVVDDMRRKLHQGVRTPETSSTESPTLSEAGKRGRATIGVASTRSAGRPGRQAA